MADYPDDFSNYPKSIAEVKSENDHNAALWSPRDVLIDTLRDLDSGKIKADALIVVSSEYRTNGETHTKWAASGQNLLVSLGLLQYAQHRIMSDDNFR